MGVCADVGMLTPAPEGFVSTLRTPDCHILFLDVRIPLNKSHFWAGFTRHRRLKSFFLQVVDFAFPRSTNKYEGKYEGERLMGVTVHWILC